MGVFSSHQQCLWRQHAGVASVVMSLSSINLLARASFWERDIGTEPLKFSKILENGLVL